MYKFTTDEILNLLQTNEPNYIFYNYDEDLMSASDPKGLIRIIYAFWANHDRELVSSHKWETYENYIRIYDNIIEVKNVVNSKITKLIFANAEYANYTYLHLIDQIKHDHTSIEVDLDFLFILNKGLNGKLIVDIDYNFRTIYTVYTLDYVTNQTKKDNYMKTNGYYLLNDLSDFIAILNWNIFSMQNGVESRIMTFKDLINEAIKTGQTLDNIISLEYNYVNIYYADRSTHGVIKSSSIHIYTPNIEYAVYVRNNLIGAMNSIINKGAMR